MSFVKPDRFSLQWCGWRLTMLALLFGLLAAGGCGSGKDGGDVDATSALGKVMAEQAAKLCNGKGRVVLVVSENDHGQATPYGRAFDAFRQTLGSAVPVSAIEVVKTPKALGPGSEPWPAAAFAEMLQKHSSADYLVSFVRVPALTAGQIAQLPSPHPLVVSVIPDPRLTKAMFAGKVLGLAVIAKPEASETAPGTSVQNLFDANYQIVTAGTASLLAR